MTKTEVASSSGPRKTGEQSSALRGCSRCEAELVLRLRPGLRQRRGQQRGVQPSCPAKAGPSRSQPSRGDQERRLLFAGETVVQQGGTATDQAHLLSSRPEVLLRCRKHTSESEPKPSQIFQRRLFGFPSSSSKTSLRLEGPGPFFSNVDLPRVQADLVGKGHWVGGEGFRNGGKSRNPENTAMLQPMPRCHEL